MPKIKMDLVLREESRHSVWTKTGSDTAIMVSPDLCATKDGVTEKLQLFAERWGCQLKVRIH